MYEFLKSFVAWGLSPLIAGIALQAASFAVRSRKASYSLSLAGLLVLLVGSLPVLSFESNRTREHVYQTLRIPDDVDPRITKDIVVLGTGYNPDPELPFNSQVSGTFHARLLEGLRILREFPESRMFVSVANIRATREEKEVFLAGMLRLLEIDEARVDLISEAESTDDEARLVAAQVGGGASVILATSAGHMPRAVAAFSNAGMKPIPAPCDFWYPRRGSPGDKWWKQWIPSAGGTGATQQALYEWVASLRERMRG